MRYRLFIIIVILYSSTFPLFSQHYAYKQYTVKDGLPSNNVYNVIQDSKGFMWFATDNGVARFDGYTFQVYDNSNGLDDNVVFRLYEDHQQRIWMATYSGKLYYYDYRKEAVFPYAYNHKIMEFTEKKRAAVVSLIIDKNNTVYYGIMNIGVIIIDSLGNKDVIKEGRKYQRKGKGVVYEIDSTVGFQSNLIRDQNIEWEIWKEGGLKTPVGETAGKKVLDVKKWNKNTWLIAAEQKLYLLKEGQKIQEVYQFKSTINWIYVEDGHLWIALAEEGIAYFNDTNFKKEPIYFFKDQKAAGITRDHENGYWFTMINGGVYYVPSISVLSYDYNDGLAMNMVNSITSDEEGNMYVGQNNGKISVLNSRGIQIKDYSIGNAESICREVLVLENGRKWINSGHILIEEKGEIREVGNVWSRFLCLSPDGWIWSISSSLKAFDFKGNEIVEVRNTTPPFSGLISVHSSDTGLLYIGSHVGLWKYKYNAKDPADGELIYLGEKDVRLKKKVTSINSSGGLLWVGVQGEGVVVMKNEKIVSVIKEEDGLISNQIIAIEAFENQLWVGTRRGLSKISIREHVPLQYTIENINSLGGLICDEVTSLHQKNGKLWIGTTQGLSVLEIESWISDSRRIDVGIDKITINDKEVSLNDYYQVDFEDNFLEIEFSGRSYKDAGNIPYRYIMRGLDHDWRYTKETKVHYSAIPPGAYTFDVQAQNREGKWTLLNRNMIFGIIPHREGKWTLLNRNMIFEIIPPYYQTWWFKISIIITVGLIIYFFFKSRFLRMKKELDLKEKAIEANQKAWRAQMNPHFIFNALNSIEHFVSKKESKKASKYLIDFAKLMRLILQNSREELVALQDEMDALNYYLELEQLRLSNKFVYEINVEKDIDTENIGILPMIIQPYVENSIKHGIRGLERDGKISITIKKKENGLVCEVLDNGIGRKKAMELETQEKNKYESTAMVLTMQRLDNLKGKNKGSVKIIDIKNAQTRGTKVVLNIPCEELI